VGEWQTTITRQVGPATVTDDQQDDGGPERHKKNCRRQ
jgi:hypothetical protein